MAGQKNPDVELLFGVAGGGSVDGESGKLIKEQLESIISSINSKPMPIKVEIDDSSIKAIKRYTRSGFCRYSLENDFHVS